MRSGTQGKGIGPRTPTLLLAESDEIAHAFYALFSNALLMALFSNR